jgi:hypothetical protein
MFCEFRNEAGSTFLGGASSATNLQCWGKNNGKSPGTPNFMILARGKC